MVFYVENIVGISLIGIGVFYIIMVSFTTLEILNLSYGTFVLGFASDEAIQNTTRTKMVSRKRVRIFTMTVFIKLFVN